MAFLLVNNPPDMTIHTAVATAPASGTAETWSVTVAAPTSTQQALPALPGGTYLPCYLPSGEIVYVSGGTLTAGIQSLTVMRAMEGSPVTTYAGGDAVAMKPGATVASLAFTLPLSTAGDLLYEAGGADMTRGLATGNYTVSANDFGSGADRAFDGDDSTYVYYGAGTAGWWIKVDLGAAQTIGSMRLLQAVASITAYQLQGWNGSGWDVVATRGTVSNPDVFSFTPATYQIWRILSTTVTGATNISTWSLFQATTPARLAAPSGLNRPRLGFSGGYPAWADDAPVSTKTANYTILATEHKTAFVANAASLVFTLPAPATAGAGFCISIKNKNQTGTSYKTNAAGVLIDGVDCSTTACTTGLTTAYGGVTIFTDGTAWYTAAAETLTTVSAVLGSDFAVSLNTWQDVLSIAITPGTWFVFAQSSLYNTTTWYLNRLWDGVSVVYSSIQSGGNSAPYPALALAALLVVTSNQNVKLSVYSAQGSGPAVQSTTVTSPQGANACRLMAVKVA